MRNRQRKTNRGVPREVLVMAATELEVGDRSVREVARNFGICHVTLNRYVRKLKKLQEAGSLQLPAVGYTSHRKVFNAEQERELSDYLTTASTMYFGLSPKEVRKLAFQCAKTFGCVYPESWNSNEMAGQEWFTSFLKRNPNLSIHCPGPTSPSTATSFNRTNVSSFFTNLATVLEKYAFEAKDIWNSDETVVTAVRDIEKVFASEGTKQAAISGEKGCLVTAAVAVNAQGECIPPLFIFPQNKNRTSAPKGSAGAADPSGWMQEEEFLFFLHHFVLHTRASSESKVLLLLEKRASRVSVACVDFCEENGVVLLAFPPHCSKALQPLGRCAPGPFKTNIATCMDNWLKDHSGATATVYDLPGIVAQALPNARDIVESFRCAGIWPFSDALFTEADFAPGFVSDGLAGASAATAAAPAEPFAAAGLTEPAIAAAAGSCASNLSPLPARGSRPDAARPFAKAEPRTSSAKKMSIGAILTDSCVKRTLEEEAGKKKKSGHRKTKRRLGLTSRSHNRPTRQACQENCPSLVCKEELASSFPAPSPAPPASLEVLLNSPFMPRDPVDSQKCTIAEIKAMASQKHVGVLEARVSRVKRSSEVAEVQTCDIEDASGCTKPRLWEDRTAVVSAGASYRFTDLVTRKLAGQLYLSAGRSSTATMTADLQGLPACEKDLSNDEAAPSTVTGQIGAVEITVSHRCCRCQKTQSSFEAKARFHRCENCRMLQKSNMYLSTGSGTMDVLGKYGDQNLLIGNSVMKNYLESEGVLHLMLDPRYVEEHFLDGGLFEFTLYNDVVIAMCRSGLDFTNEDYSMDTMVGCFLDASNKGSPKQDKA